MFYKNVQFSCKIIQKTYCNSCCNSDKVSFAINVLVTCQNFEKWYKTYFLAMWPILLVSYNQLSNYFFLLYSIGCPWFISSFLFQHNSIVCFLHICYSHPTKGLSCFLTFCVCSYNWSFTQLYFNPIAFMFLCTFSPIASCLCLQKTHFSPMYNYRSVVPGLEIETTFFVFAHNGKMKYAVYSEVL